jgi:hypothetical protein
MRLGSYARVAICTISSACGWYLKVSLFFRRSS